MNSIAEAMAGEGRDIRFDYGKRYVNSIESAILDLGAKGQVWSLSCLIELLTSIPPEAKTMPQKKTEKKSNEADDHALFHLMYPFATLLLGYTS